MDVKDFNWVYIKEQLEKAVKLEQDKNHLSIKMTVLESNIKENQMVGSMLKDEDEMKQSLGQFLGENRPLDCDIEINQDEKYILMKFQNKKEFKKVYNLLHEMFFGEYFKKLVEATKAIFGDMFRQE